MRDLMTVYEEAHFGKQAALPSEGFADDIARAASVDEIDKILGTFDRYSHNYRPEALRAMSKRLGGNIPDEVLDIVEDLPKARQSIMARRAELEAAAPKAQYRGMATSRGVDPEPVAEPAVSRKTKMGKKRRKPRAAQVAASESASGIAAYKRPKNWDEMTPTRLPEFLEMGKKKLGGLIRNQKIIRALKKIAPVAGIAGIPIAGYAAIKGLSALSGSKKSASDDRGVISRFADYFAMNKLTPENRKLRDTVEQLIRDEKRLRAKAKDEIIKAKTRIDEPASTGPVSWITDLVRSTIPGLAPTAAPKDDGIVKGAEDEGPSGLGTMAHLGAVGAGAGLGAGIQRGTFGGHRAAKMLVPEMESDLAGDVLKRVGDLPGMTGRIKSWLKGVAVSPEDIALLSQGQGGVTSALEGASDLLTTGSVGSRKKQLFRQLEGIIPDKRLREGVLDRLSQLAGKAGSKLTRGGWAGAGIGAGIATLPFLLYNLIRARRVRARGGPEAYSSRERAVKLLAKAEKLKSERQKILKQLEPTLGG